MRPKPKDDKLGLTKHLSLRICYSTQCYKMLMLSLSTDNFYKHLESVFLNFYHFLWEPFSGKSVYIPQSYNTESLSTDGDVY